MEWVNRISGKQQKAVGQRRRGRLFGFCALRRPCLGGRELFPEGSALTANGSALLLLAGSPPRATKHAGARTHAACRAPNLISHHVSSYGSYRSSWPRQPPAATFSVQNGQNHTVHVFRAVWQWMFSGTQDSTNFCLVSNNASQQTCLREHSDVDNCQ